VAAIQWRQQPPPIATWRMSFMFFPDDAIRVAAPSEYPLDLKRNMFQLFGEAMEDIVSKFMEGRTTTLELFKPLNVDDAVIQ
jgi:hypothetical protein